MATLKSLGTRMRKLDKSIRTKVNRLAQQTASDVLTIVTTDGVTKVDTSEAISNWRIGLGSKDPSTRSPFFPGKAGLTAAASRAEVRTVGRIKIKSKLPGQEIHISNSVDHIGVAFPENVERVLQIPRQKLRERIERLKL